MLAWVRADTVRQMAKVDIGATDDTPRRGVLRHVPIRFFPRLQSAGGQALVEFAMVVPMILLLALGIFDFGQAYNYKNDQTSLANQALRYAEVNACSVCNNAPIEVYIKTTADSPELRDGTSGTFGVATPGVTISFCLPQVAGQPTTTGQVGDALQATATSTYRWLPILNIGTVTITATAIGRIEQKYNTPPTASNDAYANGTTASSPQLSACPS